MTWKLYALVSAGAFLATYVVSSPKTELAHANASASVPRNASQVAGESEIEALADSLRVRLRTESALRAPARDPFQFQTRVIQKAPVSAPPPAAVENVLPPPPPMPVLSLTGIATDIVDGAPQRSAVLSAPAGVLIVREGESVGGLY